MTELNLNSKWFCYCILGKINSKAESLHYLDNWMEIYLLLDEFLKDCPVKSLISEQTKDIIVKIGKDGIPHTNSKKAPTGGTLQWNEKNNRKICTLYLQEQLEEIIKVEKDGTDYYDWIIEQFPTRNTSVRFDGNYVYGYLSENINIKKAYNDLPDFLFELSPTFNPNKATKANFEINLYISERYLLKKGLENANEFVLQIGSLAKAIKIGRATTPYHKTYTDEKGSNCMIVYVGCNFADRETLAFSKIGIENWVTLYEKK